MPATKRHQQRLIERGVLSPHDGPGLQGARFASIGSL